MQHTYHNSILGGTFDHFHAGHAKFLGTAFAQSKYVTIGLVADNPAHKLLADQVEEYDVRLASLTHYLFSHDLLARTSIVSLHDIYGTSLTDASIEAIFVTATTKPNAELINAKRQCLGLTPLSVVTIPFILSDDDEIISSSRIRAGLIDRFGHSYEKELLNRSTHYLPTNLRSSLETPLGPAIKNAMEITNYIPNSATVISVGDIVSMDLIAASFIPTISIIDYHTRRRKIGIGLIKKYFPVIHHHLNNDPATINAQISPILLESLSTADSDKGTRVIAIKGEEDLLVIPAVLLAPLGAYVVYGQYELGMIIAKVTEELKSHVKQLLAQFS